MTGAVLQSQEAADRAKLCVGLCHCNHVDFVLPRGLFAIRPLPGIMVLNDVLALPCCLLKDGLFPVAHLMKMSVLKANEPLSHC